MKGGFFVSKSQALVIILLFVIIVVGVGLMAGLIKAPCSETVTDDSSTSPLDTTPAVTMTTTDAGEDGPWRDAFLPSFTYPVHYDMWFNPDFYYDAGTFKGKSNITINVTAETKYLLIHYKMMNITMTKVTHAETGREIKVVRKFAYEPHQYWVTEVDEVLTSGDSVVLHLEFEGSLLNGIVGYYKSTYFNSLTNETSWMATTKFQPTDARKAFPNFDEPMYKATFTITLRHWSNFTALSNMPNETSTTDGIWTETKFQKSPMMSSYLVCFIVSDFKYKENTLASGVPHRVWARPDRIDQVDYALSIGKNVSDYFAMEYGQDFHLPKLDHVAVPDYPSGATEHWGLITYRQARLLYDENQNSERDKEGVAGIVSHELAHNYFGNLVTNLWWDELWLNEGFASYYGDVGVSVAEPAWAMYFGNLVTCRWWDELWLNEGFARYVQKKAVLQAQPTWKMMDSFVVSTLQSIMQTDATVTSRQVVLPVTHPDEINQAFDGIVYSKGASVLRMMEDMFGHDTFRKSIQRYLRDHKYNTAITPDLWASFQEEVGNAMNVTTIMNPWVYQMGFPVIDLTTLPSGEMKATPRRFLSNPASDPSKPETPYNYEWYLSLTYQTPTNSGRMWLNKTEITFRDPRDSATQWIKFNQKESGFYRVNYEQKLWELLADQLMSDHMVFDPVDRANLLDDAFALATATQLNYTVALKMTKYMEKEISYFPWRTVSSALSYIGGIIYGHEDYDLWRKYIRDLTSHAMDSLQVKDDGEHLEKLLRGRIMELSCGHDHPGCINNVTILFKAWIADPVAHAIPANIRHAVYEYGMRYSGTEVEWNIMWKRFLADSSGQEGYSILYALAQSKQLWLIQKYLEYCLDPQKIRSQDFFIAVNYAAANPTASYYVWSWVQANYETLVERFGVQDRYFGRMVPNIVSQFKSPFHLQEVSEFYAKYPDAGAGAMPRIQSLENIRGRIAWRDQNEESVASWLTANVQL